MALPFSNVETAYRVEAGERAWSANCAWDALAIPRLLRLADARIVDRGGPDRPGAVRSVARGELVERDGVVSFPLPARRWWDDIVFT
jgi:alkylmercury lyase-like protein